VSAGEDVVVINSFSKYFQMTGWRLGWLVVPPRLAREVEKLAQNLFISPSTLAQHAALACMDSFGTTDFRADLKKVKVPTLVLHGDADAIVPIEGSGQRTHRAVPHSKLVVVHGAPHGLNVSHAQAFNDALLSFLRV